MPNTSPNEEQRRLPLGSKALVVDEHGDPKNWPPSAGLSEDER